MQADFIIYLYQMTDLKLNVLENYGHDVIALCLFLNNCTIEELKSKADDEIIELLDDAESRINDNDYDVLTDEEADDRRHEEIENYYDECIQPELDKIGGNLSSYFDYKARERDAKYDGRGHSIARYDGQENEQEYNGTMFYIYKQN